MWPDTATLTRVGVVLGAIGGGALFGAVLTAFVTPVSGRELRRKIADMIAPPQPQALPPGDDADDDGEWALDPGEIVDVPGSENFDRRQHAR